jgi:aminoglycoside phosphotransferase (APT) family kinase protein
MDSDLIAQLAEQLDVRLEMRETTHGMSRSQVHFASRENGGTCVLKVTSLRRKDDVRAGRRELAFYRDLAGQLPIRTPALLDYYEDNDVIAMLLSAHGETESATSWDKRSWQALAVDLARLHGTAIPEPDRNHNHWRNDRSPTHALRKPDLPVVDGFWREDFGSRLDAIIENREILEQEIFQAGECFVHGDCHTGNILRGHGALVWIDWQSTGIGNPAMDLAFLDARATPSGARIPPELLATYCSERDIDLERMRRPVIAAELSIFIFEWPPYASFNSVTGTQRVRRRTGELAEQWFEIAGLT